METILRQLNPAQTDLYLEPSYIYIEQERSIIRRLIDACSNLQSTSAMVVGNDFRISFADRLVRSLRHQSRVFEHAVIANISGSHSLSDSHALSQIAECFLVRDHTEVNNNVVLEDLEHFLIVRNLIVIRKPSNMLFSNVGRTAHQP